MGGMGGSSYYERLGLQLDPSLSSVVPDPSQALEEVLALLRAMIRNKCVNYGDGQCEEARNIQTLADYLDGYGIKYQLHHMPGEQQQQQQQPSSPRSRRACRWLSPSRAANEPVVVGPWCVVMGGCVGKPKRLNLIAEYGTGSPRYKALLLLGLLDGAGGRE